ncbi:MAG: cytochrome b [Telmatospirillum sp.]|nr:cytochrome b [Telmatospirillum sp.]
MSELQAPEDPPSRYNSSSQGLHWLSAALMFTVVPIAWYMQTLAKDAPGRGDWYTVHKSIGMLILLLTLVRLGWRHFAPKPAPLATLRPWETFLSGAIHILLYLILLGMPLSGYIGSTAAGRPVTLFNLVTVPALFAPDKALAHLAHEAHEAGQWAVYLLVALHVAAALFHALIRRDGVLRRMLPAWAAR